MPHQAILIWLIIKQSAIQFVALFGIFILGGAVLTFISRWTNNAFRQFLFPNFGMYLFGVIGVPVHEFCHAFFCKMFGHELKKVKWFDPQAKNGAHGSVEHLYNPWNLYHRIGQFFIGLGPVILGPILIAGLFYALVPTSRGLIPDSLPNFQAGLTVAKGFWQVLASKATLTSWGFYVFLYLAISISSQMELSGADLEQAAKGTVPLLLLLLAINSVAVLFNLGWHGRAIGAGWLMIALGACLFTFAALSALLNLGLCTILFSAVNKMCGREVINPFRS